jgi:hypothetical protein
MANEVFTTVELAEMLETSPSSISRAARRASVGLRRSDGRLVGIERKDLRAIESHLNYLAGNPQWRSAEKKKTAKKRAAKRAEGRQE